MHDLEIKLKARGVSNTDRIVEFQASYGGQVQYNGLNRWVWGVIHECPSEMEPNELEVLDPEGPEELPLVQCVDADPQDAIFLDPNGQIYDCCACLLYGSFEAMFKVEEILKGYAFDYQNWREIKEKEASVLDESVGIEEFQDSVVTLRRWGEYIVKIKQSQIIGLYRRTE